MALNIQDLPSGKIPDGIFLQAGLAVLALRTYRRKPKHRSAFQVLTRTKQLVRCGRKKPAHQARVCRYCAHQDLNLEPTDYESVALTD